MYVGVCRYVCVCVCMCACEGVCMRVSSSERHGKTAGIRQWGWGEARRQE